MKNKKFKFPKSFILTGTANDGFRHRYTIEKNEAFKDIFIKFMEELGFDPIEIKKGFSVFDDIKGDVQLKVSDFEDVCRHYENESYDIDVFYGNKKIIFVIRTIKRKKVIKDLEKNSRWRIFPKVKKIKNKPIMNGLTLKNRR